MDPENLTRSTTTSAQDIERSKGELANVVALTAMPAIFFACLAMFTVLGDTNYASKFENGELPPGFDGTGGQTAAIVAPICALFALIAVVGSLRIRATKTAGVVAVLGFLAAIPLVPLEFFTWALAFE
jgi:hypothetical protein